MAPVANGNGDRLPEGLAKHSSTLVVLALATMYIANSSALISYNKYLIHNDRFPFAVSLGFLHAVFCSVLAYILYCIRPALFPSLSEPSQRVSLNSSLLFRGAMPVALLFSVQLAFSNSAFLHCSVAFLQMMKEANLAIVYTMSLVACLESFKPRNASILVGVVLATMMTIHGEVHFSFIGFSMQGFSQLFECTKIVLQAMMLTGPSGKSLDPATYVLLVMPLCALFLGLALCSSAWWASQGHSMVPTLEVVYKWWPHLLLNSFLAFSLNVVVATFMKYSSAIAFVLAGIVKDAVIVLSGFVFLKEALTAVQLMGFTIQLACITLYTFLKLHPKLFEDGLLVGLAAILSNGLPSGQDGKSTSTAPLAAKKLEYGAVMDNNKSSEGNSSTESPTESDVESSNHDPEAPTPVEGVEESEAIIGGHNKKLP
mmetsp:Transcript_11067/g.24376  ORF Transcript_11067/g.24376 Transcript_11067/m.24376 type:complete len:428 (+) Transcript_11067:23-1306(+)